MKSIRIVLAKIAVVAALALPACGGMFSSGGSDTGDGGIGEGGTGGTGGMGDGGVAEATAAEGGGVCCPIVTDPCSACGSKYLGGWAADTVDCASQGGPCDGLIGVVQDSHGCPVIRTGEGQCCGCAPGPDGGGPADAPASSDGPTSSDGSTARTLDCVPDASVMPPGDPNIKDTVSGTNGVFVDACDSNGNLTDYVCERTTVCGPGPDPLCQVFLTGLVKPQSLDCSGHCVDGRCDGRCPAIGQSFHYVTVDPSSGAATIKNDSDGRTYVCTLVFDSTQDTFDCTKGPTPGSGGTIFSLGLSGSYCTGGNYGNIGVHENGVMPDGENCAYSCTIP